MKGAPWLTVRRGGHAPELGAAVYLAAFAALPVALVLRRVWSSGGQWSGADGLFVGDQLQYFAWIRDAADHGLASNLLSLDPSAHVFAHPMFSLSGLLVAAGVSIQAAYLVWKPVAVVVLLVGTALYARRLLGDGRRVALALVLALASWTPAAMLLNLTGAGSAEDRSRLDAISGGLFPAGHLWGYLPIAIAIGLMCLFFLGLQRAVEPSARRGGHGASWYLGWTAVAGALVSWLHPWQGETLVLVVAFLLLRHRRDRSAARRLAACLAATLVPLVGYYGLSKLDASWALAARQNRASLYPLWIVAAAFVPICALAASAARRPATDIQEEALRGWPVASMVVYVLLSPSVPFHSFEGMSVPLAVLAVRSCRSDRALRALAVGAAVLCLYGTLHSVDSFRAGLHQGTQPYVIRRDESRALAYLRGSSRPGGVIAPTYLGTAVPAFAARATWSGHPSWTPDFFGRDRAVTKLFAGRLSPRSSLALVRGSGARFALSDCRGSVDLTSALRPLLSGVRRFGCATVYELGL